MAIRASPWMAIIFILGWGTAEAEENSPFSFLERPLSLCTGELDRRIEEINPAELYNLHLQSELYAEKQNLPGWMKKSCQEGLEKWVKELEWYKPMLEKIKLIMPKLALRPYAVAERKDDRLSLKVAPPVKELEKNPDWRIKFGLDVDTDISALRGENYGKFVTPALKIQALYGDWKIRLKANPLLEKYRLKISSDRYYYDLASPEFSYKNEKRDGETKHLFEAGVGFKTWSPALRAGVSGEVNAEDISDWHVGGRLYGFWDWECAIIPSWCK